MTMVKVNRKKDASTPQLPETPPAAISLVTGMPKSSNPIVRAIDNARQEGVNVETTPLLIEEAENALRAWKEELSSKARQLIQSWQVLAGEADLPKNKPAPTARAASGSMQERIDALVAYLKKHPESRSGDICKEMNWKKSIWAPTAAKAKEQKVIKQEGKTTGARWSVAT